MASIVPRLLTHLLIAYALADALFLLYEMNYGLFF